MQENLQALNCKEQSLRMLFELSRRLVISLNLDDILQATVDGVTTLTGLNTAAVYLLQNNSMRLYNTTPPLPPDFPDELRYGILDNFPFMCKAIELSAPILIPDVKDVVLSPAEQSMIAMRNLRTLLFLPLIAETEVLGALIVGSTFNPISISDSETDLSHTLANFAALAVKNAKLYQVGQMYVAELEHTIAERKKAEEDREVLRNQLIQAQKMDAIGQLAGGIAHDFNNMLCGIIGNAELLKLELSDAVLLQLANEIVTIGRRSAGLISQLLAFSRKGQNQIVALDLHQIINEVVSILKHTINPKIEIKTDLQNNPSITEGDPAQIQSTLLNLAVNARDAMPDGGILTISTRYINIDAVNCHQYTCEPQPGQYIKISVTDTGIGMDAATLERIYEPFFTTKKQGEGTGMGLSAVYGIMKTHSGGINVISAPEHGTTFSLCFPFKDLSGKVVSEAKAQINTDQNYKSSANTKKIFIIDDEMSVARITAEHLRNAGYETEICTDSIAALSYFKVHHSSISLVILDMMMPKMDGSVTYHSLKSINPGIRVILVSGYCITGAVMALLNDGAHMFIQKPYYRNDLLHSVKEVLEK